VVLTLHWDDTAEGAGPGVVLAPDKTSIILTGNSPSTSLVIGDGCDQREIRGRSGAIPRVLTRRCSSDGNILPSLTGPVGVDGAGVRPAAVRVDLVQSHVELATLRDLRKLVTRFSQDGFRALLDVVVAATESLAHGVCLLAAKSCAVLLEWPAPSTIARGAWVDA
jgi:hypothetical protein